MGFWVSMGIYECQWVPMGGYGFLGVHDCLRASGCLWVFMSIYGCLWVFMSIYGCLWVPIGVQGFLGVHGYSCVSIGIIFKH